MKLTGTLRSGQHLLKNLSKKAKDNNDKSAKNQKVWWKKPMGIVAIAGGALVVLTVAFAVPRLWPERPVVSQNPRRVSSSYIDAEITAPPVDSLNDNNNEGSGPEPITDGVRKPDTYTFLLMATDVGGGNTDVIMVVTFDAANYKLNVVSIPRDTMANVKWTAKRVNAILSQMRREYRGQGLSQEEAEKKAMQGTIEAFSDILGFKVDFWFTVDIKAFIRLIDAIGGVDFYIPTNMEYHDPEQNLHISYKQGMKKGLTGQQAMEIVRYRGYATGDIRRIDNQQSFLKTVAEQILAKKSSINVIELAEIFFSNVKTDLPLNNLIWFGKEFLKMDVEDISFATMPVNLQESVNGAAYCSLYLDEWLEMVNDMLNPLIGDITENDVSILTRGADRKLYVTDGNWQGDPSWGSSSRAPSQSSSSSGNKSGSSSNSSNSPSKNPSGSSSNNPSGSGAAEDTGESPPEGIDDPQIDGSATTDPPTDEIPPLEVDPGQTEGSANPPSPTDTPPDTSGGQGSTSTDSSASAPVESGG